MLTAAEKHKPHLYLQCLLSYSSYSPSAVSPLCLSAAGIAYDESRASTVCILCRQVFSEWQPGDDPIQKHRTASPKCPIADGLVNDESIENATKMIASAVCSKDAADNTLVTKSVLASRVVELSDLSFVDAIKRTVRRQAAEKNYVRNTVLLAESYVDATYRAIDRSRPHDELLSEAARLSTYHDWPVEKSHIVNKHQLAKNGFFYTGQSDRVQCIFCHGILSNWVEGDEAANEHRRHFPNCRFVRGLDVPNVALLDTPDTPQAQVCSKCYR